MATHILWQADVADFSAWLTVFKQDAKNRKASGIVDLHVWSDPDKLNHAVALFAVADLEKAKSFFDSEELAMHLERDGVINVSVKMLTPA
ncbi:hypothetical protein Q8W37_04950 [Shimia thalassica]|jgi:hypothetical protein|uniref:ABM domain-containing protein n=1 Tax=Shimia thalassica TaxID=1715693 RepID=A0A0P1ICV9_9RHOB|nr:hypothetical protein [Shimia thalassica]PHO04377.1 hypothetical protein CSC82_06845 [Rhodobacteraceae bacterium 4F10]MBU2943677.1 hypothetical protein [Shimia thalassica]MDO6478509.1 hypothetical protein [Shimia thalassica]MDO6484756.1 hypothetical protein [Shimia thalassica]MDO6501748.1 hypothetical protein [Shimia thalassica]